jgi:hypothetical protein
MPAVRKPSGGGRSTLTGRFIRTDGYAHKWKDPHRLSVYEAQRERGKEPAKARHHEYYVAHKEANTERCRKWGRANPEKKAQIGRRYRDRHPDREANRKKEWRWKHKGEWREYDRQRSADPTYRETRKEQRRIMRRVSKLVDHLTRLEVMDHEDLEAIRRLRLARERISYITARVVAVQGQWEGRTPSEMFESLGHTGTDTTQLYLGLNLIDMRSALGIHHVDYHVDLFKSWEIASTDPTTAGSSTNNPIGRIGEEGQ